MNLLDDAFNSSLPSNVENSYDSHAYITGDDKSAIEKRMKEYNDLTLGFQNMKLKDFNNS